MTDFGRPDSLTASFGLLLPLAVDIAECPRFQSRRVHLR